MNIMDKFTEEQQIEILEIARLGLGMVFTEIAEELDLDDDYLAELREKIQDSLAAD